MKNIEEAGSWKLEDGRPRTRHGPSARGDPAIRGKPPFGRTTAKMGKCIHIRIRGKPPFIWCNCVLIRGKPVGWLHSESRVYTAKNSVDFFGVFTPNREFYAENEEEVSGFEF